MDLRAKWEMGRVASKGNEAKLKMKQPSNMPTLRFERGGSDLWSNVMGGGVCR